jgi:hypothetical protein
MSRYPDGARLIRSTLKAIAICGRSTAEQGQCRPPPRAQDPPHPYGATPAEARHANREDLCRAARTRCGPGSDRGDDRVRVRPGSDGSDQRPHDGSPGGWPTTPVGDASECPPHQRQRPAFRWRCPSGRSGVSRYKSRHLARVFVRAHDTTHRRHSRRKVAPPDGARTSSGFRVDSLARVLGSRHQSSRHN